MNALIEASGGRRRRRVIAGEGMVTPAVPLIFKDEDAPAPEKLLPGRVRFAADHWAVIAHPEWWTPCDPKDTFTARRHRDRLERAARGVRREIERRAGGRRPPSRRRLAGRSVAQRRQRLP